MPFTVDELTASCRQSVEALVQALKREETVLAEMRPPCKTCERLCCATIGWR